MEKGWKGNTEAKQSQKQSSAMMGLNVMKYVPRILMSTSGDWKWN